MARDWVPIPEAARIIARGLLGSQTDNFPAGITREACGRLSAAAREGFIPSEGWRDGAHTREALTVEDWTSHRVDFARSRLEPPERTLRRIHPNRITGVVVDAKAIRKLANERSSQAEDEGPSPTAPADRGAMRSPGGSKEKAVAAAISSIWPTGMPSFLSAKDRNKKIVDWCKERGVSDVSGRTIERHFEKLETATSGDK